jgi:hypothetical protein
VECLGRCLADTRDDATVDYLANRGYTAVAKTATGVIAVDDWWRG